MWHAADPHGPWSETVTVKAVAEAATRPFRNPGAADLLRATVEAR